MDPNAEDARGTGTDDRDEVPINILKPDDIFTILGKVEDHEDKRSLCAVSKEFLRAMCFITLKRFTCTLPSLLHIVIPSSPNLMAFKSSLPLQNGDLKLLASSCPKLEEVLLGRPRDLVPLPEDFDDEGLSELRACSQLTKVVLSRRLNIGDSGVVSLVRCTKQLQALSLEGCVNVTDEALKAIGELTQLIALNLNDCSRITDLGLSYVADGGSKGCLVDLYLNGCVAITGSGFRALSNCVWIAELEAVNCPNITWDDVVYVVTALAVLEDLSLDRSMRIHVLEEEEVEEVEAGLKEPVQFGDENHVNVTWK